MRCIHCGGIDGDHHELCGGDDTQPPSEGMTLAQIIDKQVARIATQEAENKALREQLKSPSREEWAALERKSDYWRDKSKEQTKTIAALREQLARMPVCVGYVSDDTITMLRERRNAIRFVSDVSFKPCDKPIYIDPAPQEKQG